MQRRRYERHRRGHHHAVPAGHRPDGQRHGGHHHADQYLGSRWDLTTPPAGTLGTGATDHWVATAAASGAITITYAFDGAHGVTFTDAGTSQNCTITPADPGYSCTIGGTPQAPVDTLTGP